jgi:hypothetical protein
MRTGIAVAALAGAFGVAASPAQAAKALASSLNLSPGAGYVTVNDLNGARGADIAFQFASDDWKTRAVLSALGANASVANDQFQNKADASASASATYAPTGNAGSLSFTNSAITQIVPGSSVGGGFSAFQGAADYGFNSLFPLWNYTFVADGDGTFDFKLDFLSSQINIPARDLADWDLGFAEGASSAAVAAAAQPFTGSAAFAIAAGKTYTVALIDREHVTPAAGDVDLSFTETAAFSWSIAEAQTGAVPEPATWALLLLGFTTLGATVRRRRAALIA